jgi:hypothetical protein
MAVSVFLFVIPNEVRDLTSMFDEVPKQIQVSRRRAIVGVLISSGQIVIGVVEIIQHRRDDSFTFGAMFAAIGVVGLVLWLKRDRVN